ncbi:MAG: S41 family peptidase [Deltaproteobacteria bacterium]|nr:S41 family peptidase [Deltaproteobacteria bacterium]
MNALLTLILVIVIIAQGEIAGCLPAAAVEHGASLAAHERMNDTGAPGDAQIRGTSDQDRESSFVRTVMALLETQFVRPISERQLIESTLKKITLILPPHCTESLDPVEECLDPPGRCLMESLRSVSNSCSIELDRVVLGALRIMLKNVDPNAALLDPTMLQELKISVSGRFGGVGMVVTERDGDYVVISPFDGSPAYRAGIRPGDTILEIDGHQLHGLPLLEVLRMVRGPAGSKLSLTVRNAKTGRIERMHLKRLVISVPPVRYAMFQGAMGYLRIVNFQENTAAQVGKALQRMRDSTRSGLKGLILDLRDNPGGLFDEAILVANLFVSSGLITSIKGRGAKPENEFFASREGALPAVPTVVLINKGSASGSEILAGALQGKPHVLVLGERSFGKASVQAVFPLGKDMALRLTTAHYYTADGRDIEGQGLEPDVYVESPEDLGRDEVGKPRPEAIEEDPVVRKALEFLERGNLSNRSPFFTWY